MTASRSGGIGEWIMRQGRIPVDRYKLYAKEFNPIKYDADARVKLAKVDVEAPRRLRDVSHQGLAAEHLRRDPFKR